MQVEFLISFFPKASKFYKKNTYVQTSEIIIKTFQVFTKRMWIFLKGSLQIIPTIPLNKYLILNRLTNKVEIILRFVKKNVKVPLEVCIDEYDQPWSFYQGSWTRWGYQKLGSYSADLHSIEIQIPKIFNFLNDYKKKL